MTRFAADSSDGSTDDEEEKPQATIFPSKNEDDDDDEESESEFSSSSSSHDSDMLEDEDNDDLRYIEETGKRASPSPASSRSSPATQTQRGYRDPSVIPWAQQIGLDTQKLHVMQASLFRNQEEAAALQDISQPTAPKPFGLKMRTSRKHRRDSDGDALKLDSRERASFAHDIDPPVFRPSRKYSRVDITSSVVNGAEGAYRDAGLSMGRSFRVGWGPGGRIVHFGSLGSQNLPERPSANSSLVSLAKALPSSPLSRPAETGDTDSSSLTDVASKLLQHHLSHTSISKDESGVPRAYPNTPTQSPSSVSPSTIRAPREPLNFASFASLFPSTDTSSCGPIFRLGSALFDPLDLRIGNSRSTSITPDVRNRIDLLRRKAALSKWLENVVKPAVDGDLRIEANGGVNAKYTAADAAFSHLSGHQVDEACKKASSGGYFKLATLVSQAGGDELFRLDIRSQLDIWKSEKLAPGSNSNLTGAQSGLVGRGVWKIYSLLAGFVDPDDEQATPEDDICVGLDWKRVFGLYLWYGMSIDASIADVVKAYERSTRNKPETTTTPKRSKPVPKWVVEKQKNGYTQPPGSSRFGVFVQDDFPEDPLYALLKLYSDPTLSLTKALNPLSFSPTGVNLGVVMCWHLYIILSRVMRVRDFADRIRLPQERTQTRRRRRPVTGLVNGVGGAHHRRRDESSDADDPPADDDDLEEDCAVRPEGHSPTAELLTSAYAFELESWGMLQEAAFALLHLEGSVGREKAIKDLLARSAHKLDDWMVSGLVGSLKLPMTWVDEAKAMHELDCGNVYAAYELYISAQQYGSAHNLAVLDLAPDAIIRKDFELLLDLFKPLSTSGRPEKIDGWFVRGQLLLDYAKIMIRLPQLFEPVVADSGGGDGEGDEAQPDASQAEEIDDLTKRIPKIIAVLPEVLHRNYATDPRHPASLEEITKDLLKVAERVRPMLLAKMQKHSLSVLDDASRLNFAKGIGYTRFLRTIEE